MTISTTNSTQSFAGTQSTLTFTFTADPNVPTDIKVINRQISTGYETPLVYTTDYTVAVNSDGVGGVVTLVASYAATTLHVVKRVTSKSQSSNYDDYNQFPSDTLELDLDRNIMLHQEVQDYINDKSDKTPAWVTFSGTGTNPITPTAVYNVSNSVTKLGTGSYVVFLLPTLSTNAYGVQLTGGGTASFGTIKLTDGTSTSTTNFSISTLNNSYVAVDVAHITASILSN